MPCISAYNLTREFTSASMPNNPAGAPSNRSIWSSATPANSAPTPLKLTNVFSAMPSSGTPPSSQGMMKFSRLGVLSMPFASAGRKILCHSTAPAHGAPSKPITCSRRMATTGSTSTPARKFNAYFSVIRQTPSQPGPGGFFFKKGIRSKNVFAGPSAYFSTISRNNPSATGQSCRR